MRGWLSHQTNGAETVRHGDWLADIGIEMMRVVCASQRPAIGVVGGPPTEPVTRPSRRAGRHTHGSLPCLFLLLFVYNILTPAPAFFHSICLPLSRA